MPQICGITQLQTWDQHESICWITTLLDIVNLFHFLFDKLTRRILPIVHGPSSFTFYADQGLSPPHPPFQFVSDVKINMLKCDPQPGKLLIFLFVRYSVYIKFRVTIHVSPEKKLAVVRATRVVYTMIGYILYNLWSAACITIFDSANIIGILPPKYTA